MPNTRGYTEVQDNDNFKQAFNSALSQIATDIDGLELGTAPDEVQPYANLAAFPAVGELGVVYVAEDTDESYVWDDATAAYVVQTADAGVYDDANLSTQDPTTDPVTTKTLRDVLSNFWTAITNRATKGAVTTSGLTMATARLLGRSTASTGVVEEIQIGTGLSLSGGTLSASGALAVSAQTGTTYTLMASDNGKVLKLTNASAITLTVPSGLGVGFNCLLVQGGAGAVTVTAGTGVLVRNRQSHAKTAGQWAEISLVAHVANDFVLAGDTVA